MLHVREEDKGLTRSGCDHILTIGPDSYRVFCNFNFMVWIERTYNHVLGLEEDNRLSTRGLLNRLIEKKFDIQAIEANMLANRIVIDWFGFDRVIAFETNQVDQFIIDVGYCLGLLLGGADAGKKLSVLFALLMKAQMNQTENHHSKT